MRLALYQPDIPQNTGAALRLCAAMGVPLDIIEPCGFPLDDQSLRRVTMDYVEKARVTRHLDWDHFNLWRDTQSPAPPRRVLLTTRTTIAYTDFSFRPDDILLLGRESAGVPHDVHEACDAHVMIPVVARSLNVMMAGAIVLGEALRQVNGFAPHWFTEPTV